MRPSECCRPWSRADVGAYGLTAAELAQYRDRGFVVRKGVFSQEDLAAIGEASEALVADMLALARTGKFAMGSYLCERQWDLEVNVKFEPDDPDLVQGIEPCAHLSP